MVFELMEEVEGDGHPNYPLGYYVEAAKDYDNIEDARQYLIKPCPICAEEYPIHEVRGKTVCIWCCYFLITSTLTALPRDLVVILGCGAECKITAGHWPISDHFSKMANQNCRPFQISYFAVWWEGAVKLVGHNWNYFCYTRYTIG